MLSSSTAPAVLTHGADVDQLHLWNSLHRRYWNSEERETPTSLARFLAHLLPDRQRILELGCGSGRDAVFLHGQGHAVTATDFSQYAIDENVRFHGDSGVEFRIQDLRTPFGFADGAFDAVYARLSLHYFSDEVTRAVFREIHRVLRPGGLLLFTCRSTDDPLHGEGDRLGPSIYSSQGQIRHFFTVDYTREVLSGERRFEIDDLVLREERVYDSRSSIVRCLARRSGH
ncbi:SAM-dependent methyltransferase [Thermocatellispora tengchongensis]|uniref:SAM-dependent methyltransferase n=1 Tax=Thermocatellispora tengchongensis TaxID=1073253 RepID=A0A840P582_9ACTN|nr:class I SAM-dependent methyltransferase [Thermocatellispora tengchongensis]MBB5132640.1 SAM-dependent methyltransferase [Thermocatellispora tengchongensis]